MKSFFIILMVGLGSVAALADKESVCPGDNQVEMNMCASENYKHADNSLNMTWVELRVCKIESPEEWALIVQSQKAWIKLKEAQCELEAGLDWGIELRGSGWPLGYFGCLEQITKERTAFLQTLFTNCYEHREPGEM